MNVISVVMLVFSVLGALDYITGNHFGIGKEFERGVMLMGTMLLSMVGMIVLAPLIAELLEPALKVISENTPFEPSVIAGSLLANDMGGAPLAMELAKTEMSGYFNGLVVGSMMGATISFSLPLALGVTKPEQKNSIMLGLMCGIAAIPVGCLVAGLMLRMPLLELAINLIPLVVFSAILAVGLLKIPHICVKIFSVFGVIIKTIIIIGLVIGIAEFLLGMDIIPHTEDVMEGVRVCFNATAVMTGAFPLLYLVGKLIKKPMHKFSEKVGMNEVSALGFVGTLATNVTTFGMMKDMDDKGVVLNSAFAVSAAFTFAGHLAFTMSFNADYLAAVIVGKLVAGVCAVLVALFIYKKVKKETKA
ncbi:MAG: ethanolamine utilization protein EutH [Clostridia bacterium]|nr:ethanolamine utilization protein EutH [Clostridia bacterium]